MLLRRPVVLVADEERSMRTLLHAALADDYDILTARDGSEALTILAGVRVDLVLLDIVMARFDGLAVLEHLRASKSPSKVIVLTAVGDPQTVVLAMKLGATDYITKPFEIARLRSLVGALLGETASCDTLAGATRAGIADGRAGWPALVLASENVATRAALAVILATRAYVRVASLNTPTAGWSDGQAPDAIILDGVRGQRHCAELTRRMASRFPAVPVVRIDTVERVFFDVARCVERRPDARAFIAPSALVARVVEQVRENLGGETAQDIVETTSLSARRLYDRFRAETSMTVSAYLREVRLTAAASLLTETSDPLDAIAERVGFCDTSHLSRRFVERFGVTPGAYRRVSGRE